MRWVTSRPTCVSPYLQDGRPVGQKTGLVDMATAMKYAGVKAGAYTRPLFSSTSAVSNTKHTQNIPKDQ